jgi:uncharacterized Zn-binding protein involved in type VI secretion
MALTNDAGLSVITEGCKTSHGGYVLPISRPFKVGERAVAVVGDMTHCPKCKGDFPITEGDPNRTWHDKPMAFHGHKAACGASLIAESASADGDGTGPAQALNPQTSAFNQHLVLQDQDGKPIDGVPYRLSDERGAVVEGTTNAEGKTDVVAGKSGERLDYDLSGDKQ